MKIKESKAARARRLATANERRIKTIHKKLGRDWFHRNAKKAGAASTTKFNSETASIAANKRHHPEQFINNKKDKS